MWIKTWTTLFLPSNTAKQNDSLHCYFTPHAHLEMKLFEIMFLFILDQKNTLAVEQYNVIMWSPQGYKLVCMLPPHPLSLAWGKKWMLQKDQRSLILVHSKWTRLQMQWGFNINKQRINAEQTAKTGNGPAVEWTKTKPEQAAWNTQSTNVWLSRKIWENKKRWKRPRSLCEHTVRGP